MLHTSSHNLLHIGAPYQCINTKKHQIGAEQNKVNEKQISMPSVTIWFILRQSHVRAGNWIMQYDIKVENGIANISLEGNLNSLDLLFMLQSKAYKDTINEYSKILFDYTQICGVDLTKEDAFALAKLGKMDIENIDNISIAIAVENNERNTMEHITKSIFSDSHAKISITDTKANAIKLLLAV